MTIGILLFDLDGTLIDSSEEILDALQEAVGNAGLGQIVPRISDIGLSIRNIVRNCRPSIDEDSLARVEHEFRFAYDNRVHARTKLYPGVRESLETLFDAGFWLGLATMKPKKPTLAIMESFKLTQYFGAIRSSDSYAGPRCSKSGLVGKVMAEFGIDRSRAAYIGDHPDDMKAAFASGMRSIAALWGYGDRILLEESRPDYSIEYPEELLGLLEVR